MRNVPSMGMLGRMDDQSQSENVVRFELPSIEHVTRLQWQLARTRIAWSAKCADAWFVQAEFRRAEDLARLLRDVETWVAARRLGAIRYHLDGRAYILHAGDVEWSEWAAVEPRRMPVVGHELDQQSLES
jgi:hypothetical protein